MRSAPRTHKSQHGSGMVWGGPVRTLNFILHSSNESRWRFNNPLIISANQDSYIHPANLTFHHVFNSGWRHVTFETTVLKTAEHRRPEAAVKALVFASEARWGWKCWSTELVMTLCKEQKHVLYCALLWGCRWRYIKISREWPATVQQRIGQKQ